MTPTLSIDCIVLGDSSESDVFTVEILETENVSILKDLIKEKRSRRLHHVDALELAVWKVSVPIDDGFEEKMKALDLKSEQSLSGRTKLATLFPHKSADDCLEIVVKVPDVPTHSKLDPRLTLNCLTSGDDVNHMFSVKIAPTENVEALKEAIKEKNRNTFERVDARMLDLWKISIQIDNALKKNLENVDFTNGTLLPLTVLSTLFPEAPAEGQLHIVVKAPIGVYAQSKLDPHLTLNCLMSGEDVNRIFSVKIAPTENVAALKKAIKERQRNTLKHVDVDTLDLWKISVRIDNVQKNDLENFDFTDGALLPQTELSTLFPEAPAKSQLHLVVKVMGQSDETHPAEKAHRKLLKDGEAAAAPSDVSNSPALFKSEQEKYPIYIGRPADLRGPPIAIYHTAFAQLKDALQNLDKVVDPQEVNRVADTAKLCLASTQIYTTETECAENIYPYICSLLGIELSENVATAIGGREAESNALVKQVLDDKSFGETAGIVSHLEVKNDLGVAGLSGIQNVLELRKSLITTEYENVRNTTCCPCITICIAGPYISFGGAIYADIIVAEAFTPFIYLGETEEQILTLSRTFAAVSHAIAILKEYYRCLKLNPGPPNVNRLFPQPTYATRHPQEIPTIIGRFEYAGRKPNDYRRALFEATYKGRSVLIKFCETYHGNAHEIVAKAGYAPELFFCERLQGGVMMVIMELVSAKDASHHFGGAEKIPSDLLDDVKAAISILHNANLVFGDVRRPNILVKKTDNDRLRALLIDFELVGQADQARYPPLLNDSGEITWAAGVQPHGLMKKQHDLDMIERLNLFVTIN